MCGGNVTWCPECEKCFTLIVINLLHYNYSDVYEQLQRYGKYNLRSRGKSMFYAASIFHGASEDFFPRNFHNLAVPDNLLNVCININRRRMGDDVFPPDNLYWFITNCGMCDECWSMDDADPKANFTNAVYIMSVLVSYVYEMLIENPTTLEYIKKHEPDFLESIREDLVTMKKDNLPILSSRWLGTDAVYHYFFGMPIQLDGIVSKEHYDKFHSGYITDVIAGHPMASNGWMKEAMDEMEEMGVF